MVRPPKRYKEESAYWKRRYEEEHKLRLDIESNFSSRNPKELVKTHNIDDKGKGESEEAKPEVLKKTSDDEKSKKEVVEAQAEATLDTLSNKEGEKAETEPATSPPQEEEKEEELEIEKEEEEEEINPDDYNYCCPECNELFNELNDGRCPECNEELE